MLQSLQFRGAQFGRSAHCDGTVLALLAAAQAELRALLGGAGPSQGSGEGEEEEEEQELAKAAEEPKSNECTRGPHPTSVKFQELNPKSS